MVRLAFLLAVVLVGWLPILPPAPSLNFQCEPAPDYWYREVFSVEPVPLPEDIKIEVNPSNMARGYLQIENSSQFPLYILSLEHLPRLMQTETPPPEIWRSRLRVAHEVASYLSMAGSHTPTLDVHALMDLDRTLSDSNVLELTRPDIETLAIPTEQYSQLLMVYNDAEVYVVPFRLAYQINEAYQPQLCDITAVPSTPTPNLRATQVHENYLAIKAEQEARDNQAHKDQVIFWGVWLSALAAIGVMGWITRKRRKKDQ